MRRHLVLSLALSIAAVSSSTIAGTLKFLKNQPPNGAIITMQLTDGTVLAQGDCRQ